MATLTAITHRLHLNKDKNAYYLPMSISLWKLEEWTTFDGISPLASMGQLVGGGLSSVFLAIVLHAGPNNGDDIRLAGLKATAAWIMPYALYRSVDIAMDEAWSKLDEESLTAVAQLEDKEVMAPWLTLETWFRLGQRRLAQLNTPKCATTYVCVPSTSGSKPTNAGSLARSSISHEWE